MRHLPLVLCLLIFRPSAASAELQTRTVEYRHGETVLEGFLAYDDAVAAPQPGVLVAHAWRGHSEYARSRARQLAELGYIAFALDMYGKDVYAKDAAEAAQRSGQFKGDRALMRARATAGLAVLRDHERTDPVRIAAIGYCFGGTTVLELARSGATIAGVVSFHGGLDTPHPEDARQITCKVLALHGADDPLADADERLAFEREMRNGGVDWQMVLYGGAVHSFTDPGAADSDSPAVKYDPAADRRSWKHMQVFFNEILH